MLAVLCWAIITSFTTVHYYYQYSDLTKRMHRATIYVNLGINYGDETPTTWFNRTEVTLGATLLDVTAKVATVNYTVYPGMGVLVTSINDVENSHPYYWMWWMWTEWGGWVEGPVAADRYVVANGETLFWYYENTSISPPPKPPSG